MPPEGIDAGNEQEMDSWRARVAGTHISPDTLLATDYLNHFNEVAMMIGMVADAPEVLDDIRLWRPRSYVDHFLHGPLSYGALAAEAYQHAPPATKTAFDQTIAKLDRTILTAQEDLLAAKDEDIEVLRFTAEAANAEIMALVEQAGAVIAGSTGTMPQDEVDKLF